MPYFEQEVSLLFVGMTKGNDMSGDLVVTVIGNLTADPETRATNSGKRVTSFTVAQTGRRFDKATGEWLDGETLFIRCSAWGSMGDNAAASLVKGARVFVTGSLSHRQYETADGTKGSSLELLVDEAGPSLRYATATVVRQHSVSTPAGSAA